MTYFLRFRPTYVCNLPTSIFLGGRGPSPASDAYVLHCIRYQKVALYLKIQKVQKIEPTTAQKPFWKQSPRPYFYCFTKIVYFSICFITSQIGPCRLIPLTCIFFAYHSRITSNWRRARACSRIEYISTYMENQNSECLQFLLLPL